MRSNKDLHRERFSQPAALAKYRRAFFAFSGFSRRAFSIYLVIGDQGLSLIGDAVRRGVKVRTLTNSLASNDLVPNHAAYVGRRADILHAGVQLHELMAYPEACSELARGAPACDAGKLGLHTKSVTFDGATTFVGSFNINKRSVFLNTEMGLLVDSPELASRIATAAQSRLDPVNSWRVMLDSHGRLQWSGRRDGRDLQYSCEPKAPFWQSFSASLLSLFPAVQYF